MSTHLHCCEDMRKAIEDPGIAVAYTSKFREYGVLILDGGSSRFSIHFCPWCGQKLPESLRNRWFDELERLGIDPEDDVVSEEFTDERWHQALGL